ncbi:MAG: hypothetical protein ACTSVI_17385 [Promethearchaeota archaeon]
MHLNNGYEDLVKIYNLAFIGGKKENLLTIFKKVFDPGIEFRTGRGLFYYPFKISGDRLLRLFAFFNSVLEYVVVPKELSQADCVIIVLDLEDSNTLQRYIPVFQKILEKKGACPPIYLIGTCSGSSKSREISYFGMIALKSFIARHFKPIDIHYMELDYSVDSRVGEKFLNLLESGIPVIDRFKEGHHEKLSRAVVKTNFKKLIRLIQDYKFLSLKTGLKYLIMDERYRRYTKQFSDVVFPGYTRKHFISRGINPKFVKEILDNWEFVDDYIPSDDGKDDIASTCESLGFLNKNRFRPVILHELLIEHHLELEKAKKVIKYLNYKDIEANFHDTNFLVEELMSILEVIVLLDGQPIFPYLPNEDRGFGKLENVSMISGMFQVLDIMRSQVYVDETSEVKPVEKIKYGALNLCIAHGEKIKVVMHSVNELSRDILYKLKIFVNKFEETFHDALSCFQGDLNIFEGQGKELYHDIFTPLSNDIINKNWRLRAISEDERRMLTKLQLFLMDKLAEMQARNIIKEVFHLEDVFSLISRETRVSCSDLLLIIPGEILELVD